MPEPRKRWLLAVGDVQAAHPGRSQEWCSGFVVGQRDAEDGTEARPGDAQKNGTDYVDGYREGYASV